MPVTPTYPGVYVEELASGVHTITGVSTAVTAFLGYFPQGPMNTATQIFSVADLERNFGSLIATSEAAYGIRQFFANGGAEAWVVRVASSTHQPGLATAEIEDKTGSTVLVAAAASPGKWGNSVRLAVDYDTLVPPATTNPPAPSFNLTVTQVDSSNPPIVLATEVYRNLTLTLGATDPNYALAVVNNSSALTQLSLPQGGGTPTTLPEPTGTVGTDIHALDLSTLLAADTMTVEVGPTTLTSAVTLAVPPTSLTDLAATLQSQLRGLINPPATPTAPGVPAIPSATVALIHGTDSSGGNTVQLQISAIITHPSWTLNFGGTLAHKLGLDSPAVTNVQQYALGGTSAHAQGTSTAGSDGKPPDGQGLIGDPLAKPSKTGLYALDNVSFNILSLPDVMNLADSEAFAVISAAETYCAPRWAFFLVDAPQGGPGDSQRDTMTGIQEWLTQNATLRSSYAALYFPRLQIPDPLNGFRLRSVAPSGTIAGLYARTDGTRGVWKAPAGTTATLTNVAGLTFTMTDAENGVLNPLAINGLRVLATYGNVCWGARTLAGADQLASDWKYIPVRRLALYIEASLYLGTQWVVFEPNDEPLWSQIRLSVGTFMQNLFRQGAFQGSTPQSAYFVKCDSDTTTQADIDLGVVNILVGFAPLKPAEFVILQIQQIANQGSPT